jgi:hypothetical protein
MSTLDARSWGKRAKKKRRDAAPCREQMFCSAQRFGLVVVTTASPNFPRQKNLFGSVSNVSARLHAEVLQPFAFDQNQGPV